MVRGVPPRYLGPTLEDPRRREPSFGFRTPVTGFMVSGTGLRIQSFGYRVWGLRFGVSFRVSGKELSVEC